MKAQDVFDRANGGIVGINDDLEVYGGYDEQFSTAGATAERDDWMDPEGWDAMPKEEKLALADRMIALWQRYRDAAS